MNLNRNIRLEIGGDGKKSQCRSYHHPDHPETDYLGHLDVDKEEGLMRFLDGRTQSRGSVDPAPGTRRRRHWRSG